MWAIFYDTTLYLQRKTNSEIGWYIDIQLLYFGISTTLNLLKSHEGADDDYDDNNDYNDNDNYHDDDNNGNNDNDNYHDDDNNGNNDNDNYLDDDNNDYNDNDH